MEEKETTNVKKPGLDVKLERYPWDIAESRNGPALRRTSGRMATPQLSIHWVQLSGRPSAKLRPI